jgi:hypothetical protein
MDADGKFYRDEANEARKQLAIATARADRYFRTIDGLRAYAKEHQLADVVKRIDAALAGDYERGK